MAEPIIIQYVNILHKYGGPDAPQARAFLNERKSDVQFTRRAKTLNRLFKLKKELIDVDR